MTLAPDRVKVLRILLLLTFGFSILGVSAGDRVTVMGKHVPEIVYLGSHWICLKASFILHLRAWDFTIFCESSRDRFVAVNLRCISICVSKCLYDGSIVGRRWAVFTSETLAQRKSKTVREKLTATVVLKSPGACGKLPWDLSSESFCTIFFF